MTENGIREMIAPAVVSSTKSVFGTMLGVELTPGKVLEDRSAPHPTDGVVSLVGLAGPWMGAGSIACTPEAACRISGALLMTEFPAINEEVLDAVAEVTNMVIGNVKTVIEEHVGSMGLSIPTVIYGRNFSTKSAGHHDWTVVPFQMDEETILVQVCLVPNQDGLRSSRLGFTNPPRAGVR